MSLYRQFMGREGREKRRNRKKQLADMRANGTMPTRKQQRGTCQVCGRDVAVEVDGTVQREIVLPRSKIDALELVHRYRTSKHGYTVEPGWGFNGTCRGADAQPYETSKEKLEQHVKQARITLAGMRASAASYRAGEVETIMEEERVYDSNASRKEWGRIKLVPRTAKDFPRDKRYGFVQETWAEFCEQAAKRVEQHADSLERHIRDQQARLDAWVYAPEKIRTVLVEVK